MRVFLVCLSILTILLSQLVWAQVGVFLSGTVSSSVDVKMHSGSVDILSPSMAGQGVISVQVVEMGASRSPAGLSASPPGHLIETLTGRSISISTRNKHPGSRYRLIITVP